MGFFGRLAEGLKKTRESMARKVDAIVNSFTKIDEELFEELEETLIMSDVGVATSAEICRRLRAAVKQRGVTDAAEVRELIKEIIADMLAGGEALSISTKPSIVLVIGVNGVGKTTTIGKLAAALKRRASRCCSARLTRSARRLSTSSRFGRTAPASRWYASRKGRTRPPSCSTRSPPAARAAWT